MSDITFLVKLRDAAQMMAEASNEYLETFSPLETDESWSPDALNWIETQGPAGAYEKCVEVDNPQFSAMIQDLEAHSNKLTRNGYFYWKFTDGKAVGRKQRI